MSMIPASLKALVMPLVASRVSGLIMTMNIKDAAFITAVQKGLWPLSPFVILYEESQSLAGLEEALIPDLRLAFHAAQSDSFLEDMKDKEFSLLIDGEFLNQLERVILRLERLEDGGFALLLLNPVLLEKLDTCYRFAELEQQEDGCWCLLAKGQAVPQRRGGRKTQK